MVVINANHLSHYGVARRSGRYPWGSGGNITEEGTAQGFLAWLKSFRQKGLTDPQIAEGMGMSTTDFRAQVSIATNEVRESNIATARALKDKSYSNKAIGIRMGEPGKPIGEGTIRSWLKAHEEGKENKLQVTANMLRKQVEEKGVIDIGKGVPNSINVSEGNLATAAAILKAEGYKIHKVKIDQLGTDNETWGKVLAKPDVTFGEIVKDQTKIRLIDEYIADDGYSVLGIKPPIALNEDRIAIKYAEEGGTAADGLMYVRPGVEDVSIGGKMYAQVRVQVGDGHYIKGMAVYSNDLPDGVDVLFNTNKSDTGNKLDALKELERNPKTGEVSEANPFGTVIKRQILADPNDKASEVTSSMNLVYEEGDWSDWSKSLASQVLSKQQPKVAKAQLDATLQRRQEEFDEIMSLTNPTIRKKLLQEFADESDAAAVHLKSAGFPRQNWNVILPVNDVKPNEIYAPNFKDGETVALIRYPHGGTFEIPELRVNNSNRAAKKIMGGARDAVGIHHSVAEHLSGADFDGDTVLVIPNDKRNIKSTKALEGLKNFDPKASYPEYEGMKVMSNTQNEMGSISNLITDMTIAGAPESELVKAVRHSMVVIDAEKHKLNYKESARRENIKALKEKYQTKPDGSGGAATIVSRAKSEVRVDQRKPRPQSEGGPIDPVTGELVYVPTGKTHWKNGKPLTTKSTALGEAKDAHTLSSGTQIEALYADYSNGVKSLANQARVEYLKTPRLKYSKSAKEAYPNEVASLNAALDLAVQNAPRERRAQILAKAVVKQQKADDPTMDDAVLKKVKGQALTAMRARTGAGKSRIEITPGQWDAIQAGAISDAKLSDILANSDMEKVRELATPRTKVLMSPAKSAKAAGLLEAGYTRAEVASQLGVSISTLDRDLDE